MNRTETPSHRPRNAGKHPAVGRTSIPLPQPEIHWERLRRHLRRDIDFPARLELQAMLGRPPTT